MPTVGYATLQIIPSVRGIGNELRRQLMGPSAAAGGDAGDAAGQAAGEGFRGKLAIAAAAAGVAAGALLVKGVSDALERSQITATLQAQLGATSKDAARFGKITGELYSKGITVDVQQGADTIRAVINAGLAPPDATNKQLESIATKMADVSNTFGTDMSLQTQAVSALMKNNLAPDATAALDVITVGMQKLGPNAEDLLETFQEYPVQLKKLGIDADQALGLFRQGLKGGARDTDIIADAMKEFSIRAIDMSDGSREAYESLGLNAARMEAQIGKGGESANRGLQTVLDKLREMKDPVEREAAAVGLFGTQAEELGTALFELDPGKAAKGIGELGGAADKVGKTLRSGPSHEIEVFKRRLESGLVTVIGGTVLPLIKDLARWANDNLVPAIKGIADGVSGVVDWLREWGVWLAPLVVLIAGITLALNAQAIATAAVTAVFSVYRAAMLIGTTVTSGFAAAQAVLNAVMALNPFVLVALAIVALGVALVVAYKKSETFRTIVQGAMDAVRTAAMWLWDKALKPFFDWFGKIVAWLWTTIIKPYIGFIIAYWKLVASVAMWLWRSVLAPVFSAVGAIIKWWWNNIVKRYFGMVKFAFQTIAAVAMWLWNKAIRPVFRGIGAVISWWWTNIVKRYFGYVKTAIGVLAGVFTWLYNKAVKPVMGWISDRVKWAWNKGIKPAFDALKRAIRKVRDAFSDAKDGIGRAWDKIKSLTKKPINWVIRVVWNDGIVGLWKKIGGWIPGLPKLEKLPLLASGGPLPVQPGVFNRPTAIVGEGNPRHPEYVIPTDPKYRRRALALHQAAGSQLLARGGIIGDLAKGAVGFLTNPSKAFTKLLAPLLGKLKEVSGSPWGKMAAGLPKLAFGGLKRLVKDSFGGGAPSGPVGGSGVKRWSGLVLQALRMVGQPASLLGTVLRRMNQESGGNPKAINLWDINAKRGIPSKGLMQTIDPTFNAYAGALRGRGVWDPLANIYASMRYALARYGSLSRAYNRPGGYDSGGWLMPGLSTVYNGTGRPEAVLTAPQFRTMSALAARGASGGLQPGQPVILQLEDGPMVRGYVAGIADERVGAGFTTARRRFTAGSKGG